MNIKDFIDLVQQDVEARVEELKKLKPSGPHVSIGAPEVSVVVSQTIKRYMSLSKAQAAELEFRAAVAAEHDA